MVTDLYEHTTIQLQLLERIDQPIEAIETEYRQTGSLLQESFKSILLSKYEKARDDNSAPMAITLVDIQNDFVLDGFALYAPGGERVVLSNMALLDALCQLIQENPDVANKFEIVTSQDAHSVERSDTDLDIKIMEQSTYGKQQTQAAVNEEQKELTEDFGLHCIKGTIGAAIAQPIEHRLAKLQAHNVLIYRFGKINFSGPKAGMLLREGANLADPTLLDPAYSIYHEDGTTYLDFFNSKKYLEVLVTGICGNICVQQAAEGLAEVGHQITILDPAVHYLLLPGQFHQDVLRQTLAAYAQHTDKITYQTSKLFRSNSNLIYGHNDALKFLFESGLHQQISNVRQNVLKMQQNPDQKNSNETAIMKQFLETLYDGLFKLLETKDGTLDYRKYAFKNICMQSIKNAKSELPQNSVWQNLLLGLASFIVSVCSLGVANYISGKGMFSLFSKPNTSTTVIDEFEDYINTSMSNSR